MAVDGREFELSRAEAAALRDALGATLARREEYLRTVGEYREDGSYVVERRGADSTGHRKVFDCFDELRALYDDLPAEFTAEDVTGSGVSGGRRHMLVRHFAEHPTFDCELVSRQPLTVQKQGTAETGAEPGVQEAPAD